VASVLQSLTAVETRDAYTAGHSWRVRRISVAIGIELGLETDELDELGHAALFHDVGKSVIPDEILLKPTRLTEPEWELMRSHSVAGALMIGENGGHFERAALAVRHHHERYDGTGYPDGLAGERIPLAARIIHVADALDSMLSTRVYRRGRSARTALAEVRRGSREQFCPDCVEALAGVVAAGTLADMGLPPGTVVSAGA
jgi:HD-GYP domain-containing protein (c-di-GMP phosphodiesterase class II)